MTKEGIQKHVLSKIALAFLLIISMMAPFITAPSASAATSLTVAEALAQYDVAAKKNVTVDGYIVGYVKGETSVVKTGATDDNNYAIADSANETDLSKMIYVQVPATPTTLRSTFGLKTNPGNIGKKVSVSASLEKYFGNHAGLKAPVSAMTFVGGEVDPPPVAEAVANIAAARAVTDPAKLIKVSGTVTTGVGFWGQKGFYIQDDTAGLYAFVSAADVKPGDIVELEGKVSPYAGELQIQPTKITVKSSGNPLPAAQVIAPTGVNEDTQGERIQLNKVTITGLAKKDDYGTFEFSAVDGEGKSVIVRNDNRTGMTYDNFIQHYNEGDLVHVSGIASKFNEVYQVKALGAESFDLVNKPAVYVNVFPGFVTENTKITLASGWADATIYYTVDGSTPTTSSNVYSAPINVTENTTIKALAVSGNETSEVFSFEYQVIKSTGVQIADIQGKQHKSPYADQQVVDIEGVVTYKLDNNNFFMQDLTPDSDPATSDAVLVYSKAHTFVPGDLVSVDGKVTEFFIAGYSDMKSVDLSTTEISSTTIDKIGTKPVPAALKWEELSPPTEVIDNDKLTSFDPAEDGIDFWESIEGMLVSVKDAKVVGPQKYGEVIVATDNGGKTTFNKFGGINISANDYNPERITVDMNSVTFKAKSGDVFNGTITGPVSYEFGNFRIMTTVAALPTLVEAPIIKEVTEIAFAEDKLNVAAYNVENFSNNTANTPNEKVVKIAKSFVENMKSPDIITLVEVQDNDGETASGNTDASQSYERLIAAIVAAGGPKYNWTDIAPEYNQDGGAPGGNIRVGYLYNPQRVTLSEGTKGGSTEAVKWVDGELSKNPGRILDIPQPNTRKPIAAQFEFQGEQVVVIGAHLNSKGGDQPLFGKNQPPFLGSEAERIGLATMINAFIKKGQEQNPDLKVIVAGDMNDFEFTPTLTALKGNILTNMVEKVPAGERFSYYYQGNNQVLDHMLVTNNLAATTLIDMIHINANFMEEHGRASDHDPILVQVDLKDPVVVPDVVTLDVNKDDVSVEVGDTEQLVVTEKTTKADGSSTNKDVTASAAYTVSDSSVISVEAGLITAKAAGAATITITVGNITETVNVTVTAVPVPDVVTLDVNKNDVSVEVGKTEQLVVTEKTTKADGSSTNKDVTASAAYTVSDSSVISVEAGLITAKAAGTTTITITVGNITETVNVTVTAVPVPDVKTISVDKDSVTLEVGKTEQLKVTETTTKADETSTVADVTNTATYSGHDTSVISVVNGLITAKAAGTTTITITVGNNTKTVNVTVTAVPVPDVKTLSVDKDSVTLKVGKTEQLKVIETTTKADETSTDADVTNTATYSGHDTSVISVVNGLITAKAVGTTNVTVTVGDNSKTVKVTVTAVTSPPQPPVTPTNPGHITVDGNAVSNQANDPATKEIKVAVPALTDAQPEVSAKVPTGSLQTIAQSSKPLVIASGNTEVVVPNEVLKKIAAGNPESMTVSVKMAKSTDVNGAVSATFEFTITTVKNGNTTKVTTFSTPVEVTVPVAAAIKDPRKVAAYYVNELTNGLEYVGGTYGNGQLVFKTNHFSKFVVVENNKTFSDIQKYWAQDQIEVLASRTITSGKTDTTFNPEGKVTRAEFAVLIARSLNLPMEEYKGTFKDVTTSKEWAYAGIEAAHRAGIVNGKTTDSFDPDALITREEIATMIVRAVKYQDANLLKDVDTSKTFADEKAVGDFAKVSIKQAVGLGIVNGRAGNKLDPKANATRAEAAVMLYRALDKMNEF